MYKGYTGNILHVDLTENKIVIEEPDEKFYRKYLGGSAFGVYYSLTKIPKGIDPLNPENVITFSVGPIASSKISGASRHSVTAKSPQTGCIGTSEAGGYWAPELKKSGFDAVVIKGKAAKPVYLWIKDGMAEIRDASKIWGLFTKEAQEAIRTELGDKLIRVAQIGPAGENMVKYACISNELSHFNGRTGMGAVMGSKNLKAIAVRGTQTIEYEDPEYLAELAKIGGEKVKTLPAYQGFKALGTNTNVDELYTLNCIPTKNWSSGIMDGVENLLASEWTDSYIKPGTCYACAQSCKRNVHNTDSVDAKYGGPEYETVGMCGPNLGITDKLDIIKINEMCSKYTMDTISFGGTVGYAMECYEKGILTKEDTDGLDLRFGNADAVIKLAEMTGRREGFGNLIAEGTKYLSEHLGGEALDFAVHVKGKEFPAHMPHNKASLALAYATVAFGPDHVSSNFDGSIASEPIPYQLRGFGLDTAQDPYVLNDEKVRLYWQTQKVYSLLDTVCVCCLTFSFWTIYDFTDLTNAINAATGMNTHMDELIEIAERRLIMMRAFNTREGFTAEDDELPKRLFDDPLTGGSSDGLTVNHDDFERTKKLYYEMAGLDSEGKPTKARLLELGLDWIEI
ncbi:MAG: aldehyde ferredoxin oxidoreductase family protein [Eubacteriales bacterium]|nr:aldehyde ferredoxin oxidoreductase family protein [Eubacteriales bacterium]